LRSPRFADEPFTTGGGLSTDGISFLSPGGDGADISPRAYYDACFELEISAHIICPYA